MCIRPFWGTWFLLPAVALVLGACAGLGPGFSDIDKYRVFTPIFADNRVFFIEPEDVNNVAKLTLQAQKVDLKTTPVVRDKDPLSIIVNSIEMPQTWPETIATKTIDVAVILDISTSMAGDTNSLVVWYQKGVQPGQSLNFSNLLVHFEPRWDKRVAPLFRVRVMNVAAERNQETRQALERAQAVAGAVAGLLATPIASPIISIAGRAAALVMANEQNSMLLDYTVQFFAADAITSGGVSLGVLRKGEFMVVGKPNEQPRQFWARTFTMNKRSRVVYSDGGEVTAPLARVTVGTFESVVPKIVIERSAALLELLTTASATMNLGQLEQQVAGLRQSIDAFVVGERLRRFGAQDAGDVKKVFQKLEELKTSGTAEDRFYLLRALNDFFQPKIPFQAVDEADAYYKRHGMTKGQ